MEIYELIKELNFANLGWQILTPLIFSGADFLTGYVQALINNNVESKKMRVGLLHKVLIFLVILLGFIIKFAFNLPYVSTFICAYTVIMELVSILENLKKAGLPVGKFTKTVEVASENSNDKKVEKIIKIIKDKED